MMDSAASTPTPLAALPLCVLASSHALLDQLPVQPAPETLKTPTMRSPAARVALALGLAAAAAAPGCQAFFLGALPAAPPTSSTAQSAATTTTSSSSSHSSRFSPARCKTQPLSRSSGAALLPLCMMSGEEKESAAAAGPMPEAEGAATKSPSELMDAAAEADFVARASAAPTTMGPAMGPAKQPEEDKRKQRESFELNKPKEENKWASGAFKRGVALQVCVVLCCVVLACVVCLMFPDGTTCLFFLCLLVDWWLTQLPAGELQKIGLMCVHAERTGDRLVHMLPSLDVDLLIPRDNAPRTVNGHILRLMFNSILLSPSHPLPQPNKFYVFAEDQFARTQSSS